MQGPYQFWSASSVLWVNVKFYGWRAGAVHKDPELIRPSIPVMTHSLDQKVVARKCTAEIAGNIQAKVERQHRLVISFFVTLSTKERKATLVPSTVKILY